MRLGCACTNHSRKATGSRRGGGLSPSLAFDYSTSSLPCEEKDTGPLLRTRGGPRKFMKKTFAYHKPSQEGLDKITQLREAYSSLHDLIEATAPYTRERSVALTELETSAMWAIKSVVINDPESEVSL